MEFTVLDDSHFFSVGIKPEETFGYYLTEEMGQILRVFPINQRLRYAIPFGDPEESIEYLRSLYNAGGNRVVTVMDDGEKFGVWPGTNDLCYRREWLERFFRLLERSSDWITTGLPSQVIDSTPPLGRVYLPTASYTEMMVWSMPPDSVRKYQELADKLKTGELSEEYRPFVRAGFWRGFLRKYDEANHLHKRMLDVSHRIHSTGVRGRSKLLEEARDDLWRAQCNCAYWHGLFGGLYLTNLRHALYQCLIRAEKGLDAINYDGKEWITIRQQDFDSDGADEYIVESPVFSAIFKPATGGTIIEFDDKSREINLTNTLTRRDEAYHDKIRQGIRTLQPGESPERLEMQDFAAEEARKAGLTKALHTDWYRRSFVIDHFFNRETTLEDYAAGTFSEDGDFVNQPYQIAGQPAGKPGSIEIMLARRGGLFQPDGVKPVEVRRRFTFDSSRTGFTCRYTIINLGPQTAQARFGIELNLNLLAGDAWGRYAFIGDTPATDDARLVSQGEATEVSRFGLVDEFQNIKIVFQVSRPSTLWRAPIQTVSLSAEGYEKVYQGTSLVPTWWLSLGRDERWDLVMDFEVGAER